MLQVNYGYVTEIEGDEKEFELNDYEEAINGMLEDWVHYTTQKDHL